MHKVKRFYIIDTYNEYKDLSKPYNTRSEAYSDLVKLQGIYGTIRFYIIEQ